MKQGFSPQRLKESVKESLQLHIIIFLLEVTIKFPVSNNLKGLYCRNEKTADKLQG